MQRILGHYQPHSVDSGTQHTLLHGLLPTVRLWVQLGRHHQIPSLLHTHLHSITTQDDQVEQLLQEQSKTTNHNTILQFFTTSLLAQYHSRQDPTATRILSLYSSILQAQQQHNQQDRPTLVRVLLKKAMDNRRMLWGVLVLCLVLVVMRRQVGSMGRKAAGLVLGV